jgi:hypothetical protein
VHARNFAIPALLVASALIAQTALQRRVEGSTLISTADPSASLTFGRAFVYAGGQSIDIFKVAGAEQHFFIDAAADRSIRRFYWVQFEHYYPDNTEVYDYSRIPQKPVDLGRLAFMGDVRVKPRYFTMDDRPGSDSMAAADFLRTKGYRLDGTFVTLRLFHLPDATKRRELMVIYGEVLSPGAPEGPATAQIKAHAQANVAVR